MTPADRICPNCKTPLPGVAAFCYACGEATPAGIDLQTGERVAITKSGMTRVDLHIRLQHTLGGSYKLGERIGQGGFAEVYKAHDVRLKRDVAVKVLRPDIGLTAGMLERFRLEAEVIAGLRHPNIVPIYDIGEGNGIAYLIMPFIDGHSLRQLMESEGTISTAESVRILKEAAEGLSAAHEAGIIHRDIKPENIMLDGPRRQVLLMDFGIAKAVGGDINAEADPDGESMSLTSTGIIVGTPQYMSPEQASGDKSIDARTDQYSLAVVGYRLLSGTLPFVGDSTRAVLFKQLVTDPEPLSSRVSDLPSGLGDTIGRALAKEPSERFPDMKAFAAALQAGASELSRNSPSKDTEPTKSPKNARTTTGKKTSAGNPDGLLGTLGSWFPWGRTHPILTSGGLVIAIVIGVAMVVRVTTGIGPATNDFTPLSTVEFGGLDSISAQAGTDSAALAEVRADRSQPAPIQRRSTTQTQPQPSRPATTVASPVPPPAAQPTCSQLVTSSEWGNALATCTMAANDDNDPVAMRLIGEMYEHGNGVTADIAKAFSWYKRAAPNDGEASFRISRMYEIGEGTQQDLDANIRTLRDAARLGSQQATLTLAQRLTDGAGMDRNYDEAVIWYQKAASRGSALAMIRLADFAKRGRGMEKDEALAVEWLRKAADAGSGDAALEAAKAFLDGKGVPVNLPVGMQLLERAAELGNADAKKELDKRNG